MKIRLGSLFYVFASIVLLAGCAHSHSRGSVVLSDSGAEGHACIGEDEVSPGQKLNVFGSECKKILMNVIRSSNFKTQCKKIFLGKAEVIESSDKHYSKIRVVDDFRLKEGQIIETEREEEIK